MYYCCQADAWSRVGRLTRPSLTCPDGSGTRAGTSSLQTPTQVPAQPAHRLGTHAHSAEAPEPSYALQPTSLATGPHHVLLRSMSGLCAEGGVCMHAGFVQGRAANEYRSNWCGPLHGAIQLVVDRAMRVRPECTPLPPQLIVIPYVGAPLLSNVPGSAQVSCGCHTACSMGLTRPELLMCPPYKT